MLSRNRKTFAISSLVLNLFASQIGEFFLPHPVVMEDMDTKVSKDLLTSCSGKYSLHEISNDNGERL